MKLPENTPVFSGKHRRVPRGSAFWRVVGATIAVAILIVLLYVLFTQGRGA